MSHKGPLPTSHPKHNGSPCNLRIEWENGEIINETLNTIASDEPVSCAVYAKENRFLDEPGWKRLKSLTKKEKKILRLQNQAKLRSYTTSPK